VEARDDPALGALDDSTLVVAGIAGRGVTVCVGVADGVGAGTADRRVGVTGTLLRVTGAGVTATAAAAGAGSGLGPEGGASGEGPDCAEAGVAQAIVRTATPKSLRTEMLPTKFSPDPTSNGPTGRRR
jgi:hypothetical protein